MDIQSVMQNARVVEQAQAQVQQAQEFAKTLLAQEDQNERQQQLSTVRNIKETDNPRVESEPRRQRGASGGQTGAQEREQRHASTQQDKDQGNPPAGETDLEEGHHIDIVV